MRGSELLEIMEYVDADLIETADKIKQDLIKMRRSCREKEEVKDKITIGIKKEGRRIGAGNHYLRIGAAAACVCVLFAGSLAFWNGMRSHPVLQWTESFAANDYFKYNDTLLAGTQEQTGFADWVLPYAESRFFSDERDRLEEEGVLPRMETHPLFNLRANYNEDGSLYSLELKWYRRDAEGLENYSDLEVVAAFQEIERIEDAVYIELDENGDIREPAVTVTERDGVPIVARGRENRSKSLTFSGKDGWYQISGSWNDNYESVVMLLDWFWDHPLDFERFPIGDGDNYTSCALEDMPDVFSGFLPDFEAFGYVCESSYVSLKNGIPVRMEAHYTRDVSDRDQIHWCLETEPDAYDLSKCLGSIQELTQQKVLGALEDKTNITFLQDDYVVVVFPRSAEDAWELIQSIQK